MTVHVKVPPHHLGIGHGLYVDLLHPDPSTICPQALARGLSRVRRWGGKSTAAYSVGEHSLVVAEVVWRRTGDRRLALAGLLHDGHEGVLGFDMPSPVKHVVGSAQTDLEARLDVAIGKRLGIDPSLFHDVQVKSVDVEAGRCEGVCLGLENPYARRWIPDDWVAAQDVMTETRRMLQRMDDDAFVESRILDAMFRYGAEV